MARHLDDTRVGEYKSNWGLMFVYTIIILVGVVCLFLLPFSNEELSPVNYLIKYSHEGLYGICASCYIALFVLLFFNSFISFSTIKIGRSVYSKVARLIEFFASIGCIVFYAICILQTKEVDYLLLIKQFFCWAIINLSIIILSLVNYYRTKKISIYD